MMVSNATRPSCFKEKKKNSKIFYPNDLWQKSLNDFDLDLLNSKGLKSTEFGYHTA